MTTRRRFLLLLGALVLAVALFDLYSGWRSGAFDNDPCSRWDWFRFELTVIDCIK